VSSISVAVRAASWWWAWLRWHLGTQLDAWRGAAPTRRLDRATQIAASMRPEARWVIRQFATRLDQIPSELVQALQHLDILAPPMSQDDLVQALEHDAGRPVDQAYRELDPEPLRSDVVGCVYRAVLPDETVVAVRVRRPRVLERIHAEAQAVSWVLSGLGRLFPSQRRRAARIRRELPRQVRLNLDFVRIRRGQDFLDRIAREHRFKGVRVSRTHVPWCGERVIVSDFASGMFLLEIIAAVQSPTAASGRQLRKRDIDPQKVARNLLDFAWWSAFENYLIPAAPYPEQLVVRPGGRIRLVDAGMIIAPTARQRRLLQEMLGSLARQEIGLAARLFVKAHYPLPPIDPHELTVAVRQAMWMNLTALENPDAPVRTRAGTQLWIDLLHITRSRGVLTPMDLALVVQTFVVYGELAVQLDPDLDLLSAYRRQQRKAARREALRIVEDAELGRRTGGHWFTHRPAAIRRLATEGRLRRDELLEEVPLTYLALTSKGAFVGLQGIRSILGLVRHTGLLVLLAMVYLVWRDGHATVHDGASMVLYHPLYLSLVFLTLAMFSRRVLTRLEDIDPT
jgi:predicted unusual protein kinase regulating ubiquinone biosynthesis (AarF/ABC1/UbiB family)